MELQNYFRKIEKVISQFQKDFVAKKQKNYLIKALKFSKTKIEQKVCQKMLNQCKIIIQAKNFTSIALNQLFKQILQFEITPIFSSNCENSFQNIHTILKQIIFVIKIHNAVYQTLLMLPLSVSNQVVFYQIFNQSLDYQLKIFKNFFHFIKRNNKEHFETTDNKKLFGQISFCILQLCPKIFELVNKTKLNSQGQNNKIKDIFVNYIKFNFLIQLFCTVKKLNGSSKRNINNFNNIKSIINIQSKGKSTQNIQIKGKSTSKIQSKGKSKQKIQSKGKSKQNIQKSFTSQNGKSFISQNAKSVDEQNQRQKSKILRNILNLLGKEITKKQEKNMHFGFIQETQQKIIKFYFSEAINNICNSVQSQKYKIAIALIKQLLFNHQLQTESQESFFFSLMLIIKQFTQKINNTKQYQMFLTLLRIQIGDSLQMIQNKLDFNHLCNFIDFLVQKYQKIMNRQFNQQSFNKFQQNLNFIENYSTDSNKADSNKMDSNQHAFKNINQQIIVIITNLLQKCSKSILNCEILNTVLTIHQIFCNQVNFFNFPSITNKIKCSSFIFQQNYIKLKQQLVFILSKAFKMDKKPFQINFNISEQQFIKFFESFVDILIQSLDSCASQLQQIIFLSPKHDCKKDKQAIQHNLNIFDIFLDYLTTIYVRLFQHLNKDLKQPKKNINKKFILKLSKSFERLSITVITFKNNLQQKSEEQIGFIQICQKRVLNGVLSLINFMSQQKYQYQIGLNIISIAQRLLNQFIPLRNKQLANINRQSQENSFSRVVIKASRQKWFDEIVLFQILKICQKIKFACLNISKLKQNQIEYLKLRIIQMIHQINIYPSTVVPNEHDQMKKIFKINTECLLEIAIQNMCLMNDNFNQKLDQKINFTLIFQIFLTTFETFDKQQNQEDFNYLNWLINQKEYLSKLFLVIQTYSHLQLKNINLNIKEKLFQIYQINQKITHLLIKVIFYQIIDSLNSNNNEDSQLQQKIQFIVKNIDCWTNISSISWLKNIIFKFQNIKNKQSQNWYILSKLILRMTLNLMRTLNKEKKKNTKNVFQFKNLQNKIENFDTLEQNLNLILVKVQQLKLIQSLQVQQIKQWEKYSNSYNQINYLLLIKLMMQKNKEPIILRQYQSKLIIFLERFLDCLQNKKSESMIWTFITKIEQSNIIFKIQQLKTKNKIGQKCPEIIQNISLQLCSLLIRQFDNLKLKQSFNLNGLMQTPCFKINQSSDKNIYKQTFQRVFEQEMMKVIQQNSIEEKEQEKQLIVSELQIDIEQKHSKEDIQLSNNFYISQNTQQNQSFYQKIYRLKHLIKLLASIYIENCKNIQKCMLNQVNVSDKILLSQKNQISLQKINDVNNFVVTTQIIFSLLVNKHLYRSPIVFEVFLQMWKSSNYLIKNLKQNQCKKLIQIIKEYRNMVKQDLNGQQTKNIQIESIKRIIIIVQNELIKNLQKQNNQKQILKDYFLLVKETAFLSCLVQSCTQTNLILQTKIQKQFLNQVLNKNIQISHSLLKGLFQHKIFKDQKLCLFLLQQYSLTNINQLPNNNIQKKLKNFFQFLQNNSNFQINQRNFNKFSIYKKKDKKVKKQIKTIHLRELIQKKQYKKILMLLQFQRQEVIQQFQCQGVIQQVQCQEVIQSGLMSVQFENMCEKIKKDINQRNQFFLQVLQHILSLSSSQQNNNQIGSFKFLQVILKNIVTLISALDDTQIQKISLKITKKMKQIILQMNTQNQVPKGQRTNLSLLRSKNLQTIVCILKIYLQKRLNLIQQCKQMNIELSQDIKTNITIIFGFINQSIKSSTSSRLNISNNEEPQSIKKWLFQKFNAFSVDFLNIVNQQANFILKDILKSLRNDSQQKIQKHNKKKGMHHRLFTCGKMDFKN